MAAKGTSKGGAGGRKGGAGARKGAKASRARGAKAGPEVRRVAILGGGLGGLTAAAFLQGMPSKDGGARFECEIFEASGRIGGNMCSAYFVAPYEAPFADLAVNDFNATTYTHLVDLMRTLQEAGYEVPTGELVDKDCFFVPAGQGRPVMSYTSDEVEDPASAPEKTYLPTLKRDWQRFKDLAASVMTDPRYETMSVDRFVETEGFSTDFRDLMLLPRINAMYFMTKGDPGAMPIRGVMFYYHLQEGLGAEEGPTLRLFFAKGASQWALQLERFVRGRGTQVRVRAPAKVVRIDKGRPVVQWTEGNRVQERAYDHVVSAVPPWHLENAIVPLPPGIREAVPLFGRYEATALVHQDPRVMPADRRQWMTYNVVINAPGEQRPYTMSYVNSMHNGVPVRDPPFVTESPIVPIADKDVYGMVDLSDPEGRRRVKAIVPFVHNTVSVGTMRAQETLWGTPAQPGVQGRDNLWYTGGWTNGAGLQEQIIVASANVALRMRGYDPHPYSPVHQSSLPDHVPHYLRRSLKGAKAEPYPEGFWPSPRPPARTRTRAA